MGTANSSRSYPYSGWAFWGSPRMEGHYSEIQIVVFPTTGLLGFFMFGTFMRNKILGIVLKFQGKMSSCSKVMNKTVVGLIVQKTNMLLIDFVAENPF